jgi:hypothetical protein
MHLQVQLASINMDIVRGQFEIELAIAKTKEVDQELNPQSLHTALVRWYLQSHTQT